MNDVDTVQVPRLAKGSHHRGAGKMCAMNLVSWEHGDHLITDYPASVAPALARLAQHLNDRVCVHGAVEADLLCPPCSMGVVDVAHAMVGTGGGTAELSWRWAAAVAELAVEVFRFEFPGLATERQRTAASCRDIARQVAETPRAGISTHTEARAAGQSASSTLGMVMARSEPARTIEFAARAVALWHELAASTPVVVEPAVQARAWTAAMEAAVQYRANVTFTAPAGMFSAPASAPVAVSPVWLPSVLASGYGSSLMLTI
jgi:hypothetical protein